jgi:diaminopimelate decarboxylase
MKASLKTTADFQKPIGERNATPRGIVEAIHQELAPEVSLILEPGRSLIGDAAVLLTRVLGVKHGAEKR